MQRLKDLGKSNIEYRRYEELDHGLKNSGGKILRKEVISDINIWLQSKLGDPKKFKVGLLGDYLIDGYDQRMVTPKDMREKRIDF